MRRGGVFVGPPTAESGIATLTEALAVYGVAKVEVVAPGAEAHERMRRAAYLVLPSLTSEPLPRTLVEAFSHSLPVIASRLGPLADLVEPGRNGLLFEPGSARDLARRLAWAEAFPEKMRQMGQCARADYEARFAMEWGARRLYGERRRAARL